MIGTSTFFIVFRFVHIVAAILWAGSAFAFFVFVEPAIVAAGPAGGPIMGYMVEKRRLPIVVTSLSAFTVLGGIVLYLKVSAGLDADYITSGPGIGFTIGALAGTAAFLTGLLAIKPTVDRLSALGARIQASGGPPSPEQGAEMERLAHRLHVLGRNDLILILVAVVTMATARYW
jgi:hypothetical protein